MSNRRLVRNHPLTFDTRCGVETFKKAAPEERKAWWRILEQFNQQLITEHEKDTEWKYWLNRQPPPSNKASYLFSLMWKIDHDLRRVSATVLKEELTDRQLPTKGLSKSIMAESLRRFLMNSSREFRFLYDKSARQETLISLDEDGVVALKADLTRVRAPRIKAKKKDIQARLEAKEKRLAAMKRLEAKTLKQLKELKPRLMFSTKLPTSVFVTIMGQLGKEARKCAACVQQEWRGVAALVGNGTAKDAEGEGDGEEEEEG